MRRTFQKWLFLFVAIAFVLTFLISFSFQTKQARENAINLINLKLEDARKQIEDNRKNVAAVREFTDFAALAKARALAIMISLRPALLGNRAEFEKIRLGLDVDEMHVSDGRGILIASIPARYEGYAMDSAAQSAAFMPAITNPLFALVQDPQMKGIGEGVFQYAGVARIDQPGIVQIGYKPTRLAKAMEVADIKNLAAGFRIGVGGKIIVCRDGVIVSIDDRKYIGKRIEEYKITPTIIASRNGFTAMLDGKRYIGAVSRDNEYTIIGILPYHEMYLGRMEISIFLVLGYVILFAVVFGLVSFLVQRVVIDGIYRINRSLDKITKGDLTERVDVKTNSEFVSLSEGINSMVAALKTAIAEAAARIDAELELAKAIQLSSLPTVFPPYPDKPQFEIYASMRTAKEVGGDFYDFFLLGEHHLAAVIADVSGKGIPAALFMMTTKTLLKDLAESGLPPDRIFTEANRRLCANNELSMFVTAFMGVLDLRNGVFSFANAGHNPPLLQHAGENYTWMKTAQGLVLGGVNCFEYAGSKLTLSPGDRLFFYTDGVTEALNPAGELFSPDRLKATLNTPAARAMNVTALLGHVAREVQLFAAGAEQADDITMLAIEYKGG